MSPPEKAIAAAAGTPRRTSDWYNGTIPHEQIGMGSPKSTPRPAWLAGPPPRIHPSEARGKNAAKTPASTYPSSSAGALSKPNVSRRSVNPLRSTSPAAAATVPVIMRMRVQLVSARRELLEQRHQRHHHSTQQRPERLDARAARAARRVVVPVVVMVMAMAVPVVVPVSTGMSVVVPMPMVVVVVVVVVRVVAGGVMVVGVAGSLERGVMQQDMEQ